MSHYVAKTEEYQAITGNTAFAFPIWYLLTIDLTYKREAVVHKCDYIYLLGNGGRSPPVAGEVSGANRPVHVPKLVPNIISTMVSGAAKLRP